MLAITCYLLSFGLSYGSGPVIAATFGASATIAFTPLIDNFDSGHAPNFWGGGYYPLNTGGGRALSINYDSSQHSGSTGGSLRIDYGVPSSGDWAGMQITLAPASGTRPIVGSYRYLTFDIKGAIAGQSFKIEFQGSGGTKSHIYLTDYLDGGTSTGWQTVQIPLDAFANYSSAGAITDLQYINLVFEHDYFTACGMSTGSSVYIDNLAFGTTQLSAVRMDHFGDNYGLDALGGNMGGMGTNGDSALISFDTTNFKTFARSLKVNYSAPTGNWAGCYFIIGGGATGNVATAHDFSAYSKLKISVAGATGIAPPEKFRIELVSTNGTSSVYVPIDPACDTWSIVGPQISSTSWNTYTINLSSFTALNKATIMQMNIIFDGANVIVPTGTVYFDDIDFAQ